MDITKLLSLDPELARLLRQAAEEGRTVAVTLDDRIYRLSITPEPVNGTRRDLWAGYDPEGVRAAVRRSAALGFSAEPADLDPMIAEIRAQRDQPPSDFST